MEPSDEEVASLVQAAEGVLSELSSLSRSSGGDDLAAGAEDVLAEGAVSVCCQFAERLNATNVESAVTLLEIALSTEFSKWLSFFVFFSSSVVAAVFHCRC